MTMTKLKREQSRIGRSNVNRSKAHERRVADLFETWAGVTFRRRRVEGRDDAIRMVELASDVIPVQGDFIFTIEAKCEKGFSLDALLASPRTALFTEWWHQTCYDAKLVSQTMGRTIYPLTFFKPHPNHDWVAFSRHAVRLLKPKEGICIPDAAYVIDDTRRIWFNHLRFDAYGQLGPITGNVSHSKKNPKLVDLELDPVIFCRWRDFAASVDPTSVFLAAT